MAPFNTQMQHEKVKYSQAAKSVGLWPDFRKVLKPDTEILRK